MESSISHCCLGIKNAVNVLIIIIIRFITNIMHHNSVFCGRLTPEYQRNIHLTGITVKKLNTSRYIFIK